MRLPHGHCTEVRHKLHHLQAATLGSTQSEGKWEFSMSGPLCQAIAEQITKTIKILQS